jgi:hypothetical protein
MRGTGRGRNSERSNTRKRHKQRHQDVTLGKIFEKGSTMGGGGVGLRNFWGFSHREGLGVSLIGGRSLMGWKYETEKFWGLLCRKGL